jgi:hypothetical protein
VFYWYLLGRMCGVGLEFWWLRLPNLALSVVFVWLLIRTAAWAGQAGAGLLVAALFALTPGSILVSVVQEHYFIEAVAVLWFLERLQWVLSSGRPAPRGLWVAAVLCLWTGYVTVFIVGPGMIALGIAASRREQLQGLLVPAGIVAVLCLPLLWGAASGLSEHRRYIAAGELEGAAQDAEVAQLEHYSVDLEQGVGRGTLRLFVPDLVEQMAGGATGCESAWLGLLCLPLLLALRRASIVPVIAAAVVGTAVAGLFISWQVENTVFLWSPLLLGVFLGLGSLWPRRSARAHVVGALLAVGILGLSWHGASDQFRRAGFFPYLGTAELAERILSGGEEDVIMLYGHEQIVPLMYELCRPVSLLHWYLCSEPEWATQVAQWRAAHYEFSGRDLVAVHLEGSLSEHETGEIVALPELMERRERPHLLVLPADSLESEAPFSFFLDPGCAAVFSTPGFNLYRCPGVADHFDVESSTGLRAPAQ